MIFIFRAYCAHKFCQNCICSSFCLKQPWLFKHFRHSPRYAMMPCYMPTQWELNLYSLIIHCLDLLTLVPSLRTSSWNSHLQMLIISSVYLIQGLFTLSHGLPQSFGLTMESWGTVKKFLNYAWFDDMNLWFSVFFPWSPVQIVPISLIF